MTAVTFTKEDFDNLELVRQIVLRRLKEGGWDQLYQQWDEHHASKYVKFEVPHLQNRFIVLVSEVMWQLIIQGVITPGKDAPNPELPWFRVTSYGKSVLEAERFLPHDPAGYLNDVRNVAKSEIGKAALPYLEEALRCFTSGCHIAAVLMLGIAAEAVFLGLCAVIETKLKNASERTKFEKLQWVKPKHRWVVDKYQALPASDRKAKLPESLDITLTSLYELIRRQRNELGHPSERMPAIGRELAFVHFRLFPAFIEDVEAFATYCKKHGI